MHMQLFLINVRGMTFRITKFIASFYIYISLIQILLCISVQIKCKLCMWTFCNYVNILHLV